ncbi:HNH endonuclease signature motif containing protein [Corynebacterium glucuronolyticum]
MNKLQDKSHAWQVRVALTRCVANCRTIRAEAVTVLSRFTSMQAANPKNSFSCKPIPGTTKMRISIVADQHTARTAIDKARASHDDVATVFVTAAALDGLGEVPALEPVIVLPSGPSVVGATEHEQYNHMLSMSDGNSVTAREWSQIKLAEFGWVLLLEPITGKELGFFRFKTDWARFAGVLERKIQKAKTPVCAVEGCACGADKCQMHHIEAYAQGGKTTLENMTMLCLFHNGHNDDNPARPCYGRIERINGVDYFVPPFGGRPCLNMSACAQGEATRLAQKQAGMTPQPAL